ncbi:MAG: glycoside hydrolase family protein [Elusimicrobiaceae bacterium]|nr:glycoside hydrolase family protein [Elusimicrobiaceae bacterium]
MKEKWIQYIRFYEGLRTKPYICPAGHLTIGYGHNLENGISQQAAEFILQEDLQIAQNTVQQKFAWWRELNEVRRFVLVDMAFNMGINKLATFKKMLAAAEKGDYTTAAREMLDSRWAVQVGRRARELAEMMKKGEYV